ncbi:4-coumarate--CoA ligase [Comamonas serinivorans]|uniref:4-coumarate--CoA ligase n=1 Tax=Comamonas serinivorans TaxID=1082851 RepID=A0A1Y0EIR0_9BURK|nr:class I adenylate-forming enzyme family protein [Comamonas serinivorans]ARU03350.1 4-coumarate--CoA ligase [Comamonas serinivorans]
MSQFDDLLAQPFGTIPELIACHAQTRPDHTALIEGEQRLSYGELDAQMNRIAAALQRDGLVPGDVIAICATTSIAYVETFFGALRAGVVVAPLAPSATADHLGAMLDNSQAKLLFRDADIAQQWPAAGHTGQCIALDDRAEAGKPFSDWLTPVGTLPQPVQPDPQRGFNLIYSSGTTGVPKGIVQSLGMRWQHVNRGNVNGYTRDTIAIAATPMYSNTTLVAALPTLSMGGTLVLMPKFNAAKFLKLVEQHKVTHAMLVPVQYQRLLDAPEFDQTDLSTLTTKFCTSAPFKADLKAEVLRRWPGKLIEYYGMTEGGVGCQLECHTYPHKLHTVGKPREGTIVVMIDDQGKPLPPGELGEIVGHSAAMMNGYYRLPEKSAEIEWFDDQGRRYLRTGDVGRFDEDGFIVLGDRKKDMIISGGFNIYPQDIEAELVQHPEVRECSVIGVPSREWGETPVAYVVARDASRNPAELGAEVKAWLNGRVGKTQRVADLVVVDSLPRSEIGKVLKRDLRELYQRSTAV